MNNLAKIFSEVQSAFGNLWKSKMRGNSLEIITPFATTSHKFISVFISIQGADFIISDGGWINLGIYENTFNLDEDGFRKTVFHYQNAYNINETKDKSSTTFFYKKTNKEKSIPSLVFDIANFISSVVSTSEIEFTELTEKENKERFKSTANDYFLSFIPREKLDFKGYLDQQRKIKLNVIIKKSTTQLILVNYITGSSNYHFANSIFRTTMFFELAIKSEMSSYVTRKISLIENSAIGYNPLALSTYLNHLETSTGSELVNWSERNNLIQMLN